MCAEKKNNYDFFRNTDCPYFPCHKTDTPETFNCLFCYCPLYALGSDCGGRFVYLKNGIKDCSGCMVPHGPGGYDHVQKNYPKLAELARKNR